MTIRPTIDGTHGVVIPEPEIAFSLVSLAADLRTPWVSTLEAMERQMLIEALRYSSGAYGPAGIVLGCSKRVVHYKLQKYGLIGFGRTLRQTK